MVRLRPVWMTNHVPSVLWLGHQTFKNRRPYNLYCVGADVKPCSINQSTDDRVQDATSSATASRPSPIQPLYSKLEKGEFQSDAMVNIISNIIERLFLNTFQPRHRQSAYCPGHSTETAVLLTLNSIYNSADLGTGYSTCLLFLLQASAMRCERCL